MTPDVRPRRDAFDEVLGLAVRSTFSPEADGGEGVCGRVVASDVRLRWDQGHGPSGTPIERRAIQLGLRGEVLARYAQDWPIEIGDISDFVCEQRANAVAPYERLVTPKERVYPVAAPDVAARLGVSGE